eukprot:3239502-Lingulodinium_polyedra.AAC.1
MRSISTGSSTMLPPSPMSRMRFPAAFRKSLAPARWVRAEPSRRTPGPLARLGNSVRRSIL